MTAQTSTLLKWANILAFILMVLVNGLAGSTTILGGKFTNEISDANQRSSHLQVTYSLFGALSTFCWGFS